MKIKKEYIILVSIAVVLSLYLAFYKTGKVNYKLPEIAKTETGDYAHILIEKDGTSITLDKNNKTWRLGSSGFRADQSAADDIINSLTDLDITDLVAKSGSLKAYGLASPDVIHVTAKDKDSKVLRDILIGKHTTGGSYTYIKLRDNKNVYTARGRLRDSFDKTEDQLADKKILSFDSGKILKITIKAEGEETVFTKEEKDGKDVWKDKTGKTIETEMVNNNLKALTQIKFISYAEGKPAEAAATLLLEDKEGIHTLALSSKKADGYTGTSSYAEKPFVIDEKTGDAIMKAFDELSGKPVRE